MFIPLQFNSIGFYSTFEKTTTAVKMTVWNFYGDDNDNQKKKKKKKTMLLTYILSFHTQKMATATITMTGTTIAMAMMTLRRWPDVPFPSVFDVLEFADENKNWQAVKYEYCLQQYK